MKKRQYPFWPRIGDRVAYKRTPNKRSKWRYGRITETGIRNATGKPLNVRVRWDSGRTEVISSIGSTEPHVLIFVPDEELPKTVREWQDANGVKAIRYIPASWELYLFVREAQPYDEVLVREESTSLATLRFSPDETSEEDGGCWSNDKFESDGGNLSAGIGDDSVELPENYGPEWQ